MTEVRLSDQDWTKLRDFLRQEPRAYEGAEDQACRRFVEAVKWVSHNGAKRRLLLAGYGLWNSVYKRFVRWCEAGVGERLLAGLADDPDWEHGILDSTFVRANPCAAGAQDGLSLFYLCAHLATLKCQQNLLIQQQLIERSG